MAEDTKKINKEYYWLYGNTHTKGHKLTEKHHPKKRNDEINLVSTFQQIVNKLN
jgi:hypothetical protein